MADKKITDLSTISDVASGDLLEIVDISAASSRKVTREALAGWTFLTSPLTSTDWDGDARSTTAKTLIDLSVVFGVPAGVKAVLVRMIARDSGSSSGYNQLMLSPNSTAGSAAVQCYLQGVANDVYVSANGIVPCDVNGDIYYQITASGTGTLDAIIEIWGYWL